MKFQETYKITLALLAITLAVIGTTVTVVNAQGTDSEPDPGDFLNSTQLGDFNSLRQDVKDGLKGGFLADLASREELTEQDKKNFFAAVVEAEKNAPPLGGHVHTRDQTSRHFHCSDEPNVVFSVGSTVGVYSSASCQQSVVTFTAFASIWSRPTGYDSVGPSYSNATFASAWIYADYHSSTEYKYCGGFTASVNDEPTPQPTHKQKCRSRRT